MKAQAITARNLEKMGYLVLYSYVSASPFCGKGKATVVSRDSVAILCGNNATIFGAKSDGSIQYPSIAKSIVPTSPNWENSEIATLCR